jgi:hypothetical protein
MYAGERSIVLRLRPGYVLDTFLNWLVVMIFDQPFLEPSFNVVQVLGVVAQPDHNSCLRLRQTTASPRARFSAISSAP